MTSQEDEVKAEREVLNAKAKSLGIKSPHMGGVEQLLEKIAVAESKPEIEEEKVEIVEKTEERSVAPKMVIANVNSNNREQRIAELEKANPDNKYIFKRSGTTDVQLAALGLKATGEYVKNDMICVTDKQSFTEWQDAKKDGQRKMMDSIDSIGTKIKSHTSAAKPAPNQGD